MQNDGPKITISVKPRGSKPSPKKKLTPAKRRRVALHLMREMRRQAQRWMGRELAYVTVDHGDAHYDVLRFNGAEMTRVFCILPNCIGLIQVGATVILQYYHNDPDLPCIRGMAAAEVSYVEEVVEVPRTYSRGAWVQDLADPGLSLCGRCAADFPNATLAYWRPHNQSDELEVRGINALQLGPIIVDEFYVFGYGIVSPGPEFTGVEKIRLKAWPLSPIDRNVEELLWTVDIDLGGPRPYTSFPETANTFWDPDARRLSINWGDEAYDLTIPPLGEEPNLETLVVSFVDLDQFTGVAWDSACKINGSQNLVYLNEPGLGWVQVWDGNFSDGFPVGYTACSYTVSPFFGQSGTINRPATFWLPAKWWVIIANAVKFININTFQPPPEDSYTGIPQMQPQFMSAQFYLQRQGGVAWFPYNERTSWGDAVDLNTFSEAEAALAATFPKGPFLASMNPCDFFWLNYQGIVPNAGMWDTGGVQQERFWDRYYSNHMRESNSSSNNQPVEYLCPRSTSGANGFRWIEGSDQVSALANAAPGWVRMTDGSIIYAVIEPVGPYRAGVQSVAVRPTNEEFELIYPPDGPHHIDGTGDPEDSDCIRYGYDRTDVFVCGVPKHTYVHRTVLRFVNNGTASFEIVLSPKFSGMVYDGRTVSAELDYPVNVWQLAIIQETAAFDVDTVLVLHDFPLEAFAPPRLKVTIVDPAGVVRNETILPIEEDYNPIGRPAIRLNYPDGGNPGAGMALIRTTSRNPNLATTDSMYLQHDLFVYDIGAAGPFGPFGVDTFNLIERFTEHTSENLPLTTMPSAQDFDRLAFGANDILYFSTSDFFGWKRKSLWRV